MILHLFVFLGFTVYVNYWKFSSTRFSSGCIWQKNVLIRQSVCIFVWSSLQTRCRCSPRSLCPWCRSLEAVSRCAAAHNPSWLKSAGVSMASSWQTAITVWQWVPAACSSPLCPTWLWADTSVWPAPMLELWQAFLLTSLLPVSTRPLKAVPNKYTGLF